MTDYEQYQDYNYHQYPVDEKVQFEDDVKQEEFDESITSDEEIKKEESPFVKDGDIYKYIIQVMKAREMEIQERYTDEYINSIGFDTSLLVSAVNIISDAPTSNQLKEIIQETNDQKLLYQLQNPDVELGIHLRDQSENADFDLFEKILNYKKKEGIDLKDHDKIVNFLKESEYWLPPIIEIDDDDLLKQIQSNTDLETLAYMGESFYNKIVNEYLIQRFDDRNLKLLSYHTNNKKIFKEWALNYNLIVDGSYSADQVFLAYLGGLVSLIPFNDKNYELNLKTWITILIEPLLSQFESSDPLKFNAIEDLKLILNGDLKFELLFKSNHHHPQYLVCIKAGDHPLAGSTRSASAKFDAETKASSAVLYNPVLKQLAIDLSEQAKRSKEHSPSPFTTNPGSNSHSHSHSNSHSNPSPAQAHQSQFPTTTQPIPGQTSHPHTPIAGGFARTQPQPQPQQTIPQPHAPQPLPSQQQQFSAVNGGGGPIINQVQKASNPYPENPTAVFPQAVINEEYQRLQLEAEANILEAPIVEDELKIDTSSKEKLNQMLIKKRIGTAEYKTAKLNNSDVQVTCYIENHPIAKATSTNKKRAGHIVAQYIMNYHEFFLDRFKGRV
ncbi:hypothetical protein BN7_6112 [Wickerhamomyces ciferrii]|uniref:Uncharacterized protein n=1 Tax=Wickerhamomyces ciferrii (strain ATCC 14091 / BCRC 22168 / CBS 111 / JCM 3599 / NBRC 0793 / NRRL Y-1031 F-60-10) TaxID=1206466 RepID=K0KYM1_WICCF|nr:uncharacterized protein BN7_6112 [Wickerhamomyces ciferrii]CCH46519.1 hypothetical protein BN7_6112 [Wickerhamomyces ciferrii]